jgi:hypothetical protein
MFGLTPTRIGRVEGTRSSREAWRRPARQGRRLRAEAARQHSASVEDRRRGAMSSSTTSPTTGQHRRLSRSTLQARWCAPVRGLLVKHPCQDRPSLRILKKTEERVNASVAGRSTAYSVAGGLRYAVTTEESSDLLAAWPHTDPTLRKGSARGRDDWGNGYGGCAAPYRNRLVTDITQVIFSSVATAATDGVTSCSACNRRRRLDRDGERLRVRPRGRP